jgi:succinoglycan biosynthesis transport protein ExoP
MTLRQYLQVLRARWYVVLAGLIIGGVAAGAYVGTATKHYTAHAQLFVSTSGQASIDLSQLSAGGSFVQDQVKSYASVATTPTLTAPIIQDLGLPYTTNQLSSEISASAPLNTVLINLTVTDRSPSRAAAIANDLAARMTTYISQLETPLGQTLSPVKATVTQGAQTPSAPSSPDQDLDLGLGLIVGLLVGAAVAVALETLDNRVGGHVDIAQLTRAPVVGFIGEDTRVRERPLILLDDAFSARAEAFRQLRTNVRFLGIDSLLRTVVVTGSVEAEGKSLTAANLAIALAQAGERVTLVDADLRRPTVATTFGLSAGVGLTSILVGTASCADALQLWREDLPLRVLTAGPIPPNPSELLGSQRLVQLIAELLTDCDMVIFDSPPLLPVTDAALLSRATDGALVVTRAKSTRAGQLAAAVAALRSADAHVLGIVVNRVPRKRRSTYGSYGVYGTYTQATSSGYRPLSPVDTSLPSPALVPADPSDSPTPDRGAKRPLLNTSLGTLGSPRQTRNPTSLAVRTANAAAAASERERRVRQEQIARSTFPDSKSTG